MNRFRVFGECISAVGMVVLTLAVGFAAVMAVSQKAMQFAGLN